MVDLGDENVTELKLANEQIDQLGETKTNDEAVANNTRTKLTENAIVGSVVCRFSVLICFLFVYLLTEKSTSIVNLKIISISFHGIMSKEILVKNL